MKTTNIAMALVFSLGCVPAWSGPYAPVDPSVKMFVTAPEADVVGIPAYPGAVLYSRTKPMMPGAKNHMLVLYSADSRDDVFAYYRERLPDWTVQTMKYSGDPLIHEGSGSINLFSEEGMSIRHVLLEPGDESYGQTKITIGYHER